MPLQDPDQWTGVRNALEFGRQRPRKARGCQTKRSLTSAARVQNQFQHRQSLPAPYF